MINYLVSWGLFHKGKVIIISFRTFKECTVDHDLVELEHAYLEADELFLATHPPLKYCNKEWSLYIR